MSPLEEDETSIIDSDIEEINHLPSQVRHSQIPSAKQELKWIRTLQAGVIVLFVVVTVVASYYVFHIAKSYEDDFFRSNVALFADNMEGALKQGILRRISTLNAFSISVSLQAHSTINSSWPFMTIPAFELQASAARIAAGSQTLALLPIVNDSARQQWEHYSNIDRQRRTTYALDNSNNLRLSNSSALENASTVDDGDFSFLPVWQTSPAYLEENINFNLLSDPTLNSSAHFLFESRMAVVSGLLEPTALSNIFPFRSPYSVLLYPVFDNAAAAPDGNVIAVIATEIVWEELLTNFVPDHSSGMVIVVEDNMGQAFTYEATGTRVQLWGQGDLHDPTMDQMGNNYKLDELLLRKPTSNGTTVESAVANNIRFRVYPSSGMKHDYETCKPVVLTVVVNCIFLFSAVVFLLYNQLVERWRSKLLQNAMRSTEIVSSLFPSTVRDRLLNTDNTLNSQTNGNSTSNKSFQASAAFNGVSAQERFVSPVDNPKVNLKSFLSNVPGVGYDSDEDFRENKPIADLFTNTTVMFADICGFTAWSSAREPSQVFTLLESVYRAFDILALKRGVFKVETVGDCYMAVTGLPEPQEDHAVIMARFAQECVVKMKEVTRKLELTLGPETGELALRVGLHSGPVTAGVLRGEKSRFQLFGDTVNTASRMESTGVRDTVQLSVETAQLVFAAGKSHWLKQREDTVFAKGKGEMTTFFLTLKGDNGGSTVSSSLVQALQLDRSCVDPVPTSAESMKKSPLSLSTTLKSREQDPLSRIEPQLWGYTNLELGRENACKRDRLIDWNVEILLNLLKLVLAKRRLVNHRSNVAQNRLPTSDGCEQEQSKVSLLDEVTETIALPGFDVSIAAALVEPNPVDVSNQVVAQLRNYVVFIASMYKDIPFHNFEHASHVAMSANKLIQRIVASNGADSYNTINAKKKRFELAAKARHDYTFGISSDPLTQFAVVFSALIHDVDHPGVSNYQLVKENVPMAKLYKGKSILEQNSIDLAWDMLMQPHFKELRTSIYSTEEEAKRFRQVVVNCVMATDIFDKEPQNLRRHRWSKAFQLTARSLPLSKTEDTNRKATIVIEHIIQASDVAHTMQHWHMYHKWNERLFREMHLAFQTGRAGKHPMIGWYHGELGFFDNYVIPLANKLKDCGVFGVSGDEYLNYALENRREWAVKGEGIVRRMTEQAEQTESNAENIEVLKGV